MQVLQAVPGAGSGRSGRRGAPCPPAPSWGQHIRDEMARNSVPVLETQMHEREAFRAIFSFGGALQTLRPTQVSGLDAAIRNAHTLATEVVSLFNRTRTQDQAEVAA
jgi:chromosome partitioning protein